MTQESLAKKADTNIENEQEVEQPAGYYHSKKDRIFVRAIQGAYNMTEELNRLRTMPLPRAHKAKDIKFVDGPQAYSRHYVEPRDGITQTFHWLMYELSQQMEKDAVVVEELGAEHKTLSFSPLPTMVSPKSVVHEGRALGWGVGASAGVKLALPDRQVVSYPCRAMADSCLARQIHCGRCRVTTFRS